MQRVGVAALASTDPVLKSVVGEVEAVALALRDLGVVDDDVERWADGEVFVQVFEVLQHERVVRH